jgi:MoaA/NifB/PqqE/SkfB family radical SAM enzyme
MSFGRVMRRTWNENLLFTALVELTYRCNLDCYYCYNDLGLRGTALTRDQYFRFFEDLAAMQTMYLILSGGEPLAHPDFFPLGRRARELGFVTKIKSNGHALRGALARRVKDEIDPFMVEISLHGECAETHDRQTRVEGSFDRLMQNLPALQDLGLRIKLNSTLTAWNENEVEGMYRIADNLGALLHVDPQVTPRDDGDTSPLSISPSREGVQRLFRFQLERDRALPKQDNGPADMPDERSCMGPDGSVIRQCGAGSSGVAVDPFGNVYPCVQWRRPIGNLHEQSIHDIWHQESPELADIRQATVAVKNLVSSYGTKGNGMAYCAGLAETTTGEAVGVYPAAQRRMEIMEEVLAETADSNETNSSADSR